MLFNSTYSENLKRITIKQDIGQICIEDYEVGLLTEINKVVLSNPELEAKDIKWYRKRLDISSNDYPNHQDFLIFYYERAENDKEYNERIEKLQIQDLKEIIEILSNFNVICTKKKDIQDLWEKFKHKFYPDWQKKLIDNFFSEKTNKEYYNEGYHAGQDEQYKRNKELKKKLKELTD